MGYAVWMGFFNYWILYRNLNYFSYSNPSSIKVSQLVMRIFRCYFTCFYTSFTSCVTILIFFTLLMLNFEPDIKNVTSLSMVTRETNWKRCSFVRIGFLVVCLLLWTPRFFYIRDIWQTSSQLTNKVCFSGFFSADSPSLSHTLTSAELSFNLCPGESHNSSWALSSSLSSSRIFDYNSYITITSNVSVNVQL